jgi:hypothetical protein
MCKTWVPEVEGIFEARESDSVRGVTGNTLAERQHKPGEEKRFEGDYLGNVAWMRMAFSFNTEG